MEMHHYIMLGVVAFAFYLVGTKYPQLAMKIGF